MLLVIMSFIFSMVLLYRKSTEKYSNFNTFRCFYIQITDMFCAGLCAFGWSTLSPSMSQRNCRGESCRASCSVRGHWKEPLSRRLYRSTKPSPSQYSALIRSQRLPQKRNSVRINGSRLNCCWTMDASPSIPRRRSV